MKFFNDLWENPLMKKLIIGMGIFMLVIVFLLMFVSCTTGSRTYTYVEVEDLLVSMVMNKYKNSDLPKENSRLEISINDLISNGEMKNINEYVGNEDSCSGKVTIINNNGYYLYVPYINCGSKYKTNTLYDCLINDSLTSSGNGLYNINGEYIFKGDNVNNYVSINNTSYRVISINSDESIRLLNVSKGDKVSTVWDDRFNVDKNMNFGNNNYSLNGLNSRIKDTLESMYSGSDYFTDEEKSYFIPYESCVGKRSISESDSTGTIECSVKGDKYPVGLLSLYEYYRATLDSNCNGIESESCTNYNYLSSDDLGSIWTITADKDSSYRVYKISNGKPELSNASNLGNIRVVVHVNGELVVEKGNGSKDNPYVIKSMS